MLKKFRLPILALATALTVMAPGAMFVRGRHHEWREHHHFGVYVGPGYGYGYNPYYGNPYYGGYGYYDAWGLWHPYS
jgi:hypothetical protein